MVNVKLFRFIIDFEDIRRRQHNMIAETEEEVKIYISNKYKTNKFKITKKEEMGVRIK